ncbi:MAG: type III-B CRISPR module RAMP protein Cmr1 [Candidatus Marinimicrobia bacterium]|nr:type III-B CRISPR module RAMP protein Cmr1 [Candidatus Neomarinimicrobiota bacterium]
MYTTKFKCSVVTPMFMSGADKRTPELRPSEFKGMMRFWWRAAKAENDITKLREEEAEIFGGTGESEGKSKVNIKIVCDREMLKKFSGMNLKNDYNLQWSYGKHSGIGYILYSTVLRNSERGFIKDGFSFDFILSSMDEKTFKQTIASFWLTIYLGGLGTRARRGGGCLSVKEKAGETFGLSFVPEGNNSLKNWLIENFNRAQEMIGGKAKDFCYSYSNLSISRVMLSNKSFRDWKETLNDIGSLYSNFRLKNRNKIFLTGAFGLPVMHRNTKIVAARLGNRLKLNRRSSPIIIKVMKFNNNYYWMAIRLAGEFLPPGIVLISRDRRTQKPEYNLIDEFWNLLKRKGEEIILSIPEKLLKTVEKIKKTNPDKIVLFGSKARGDFYEKSDIDIAVYGEYPDDIEGNIDIVNIAKADQKLKEKIEREGISLYERKT